MKENCLFCKPNKLTKSAKIVETEKFKFILDPFPVNFGHILIIPKRHVKKIGGLNDEESKNLKNRVSQPETLVQENRETLRDQYFDILKTEGSEKSEEMIKTVIGNEDAPEGFNIGVNEGEAAGQTIDHLHIHVIPRYEGDVEDPKGGVRNVVPERADYT
jgi:diadenosine tetraphosphate (Ap4A) HIT family hydrolase